MNTTKRDDSGNLLSYEEQVLQEIERSRPPSLREFDQIPMISSDLLIQVKKMIPLFANKKIVFVGDHDFSSLLIGYLTKYSVMDRPQELLLLDFDKRILNQANEFAEKNGFSNILKTQPYNVFQRVPDNLPRDYDWFYTNPPYGSNNSGESARLFITRGMELVCESKSPCGCIILPDDDIRKWTREAMLETQKFLSESNWAITEKKNRMHRYHLDDDKTLESSLLIAKYVDNAEELALPMRFGGRAVQQSEIPLFYGRAIISPYPTYIGLNGLSEYS